MNYIITGGTGFIGTHLTNLIKERYPNAQVYNLDIVKPGTPNPVVKDYKPALRDGEKLQSTFIEYDIRKPIENLPFTPTEDDVIFNFAAVHRTPGHEDHEYFETNIRGAENVVAFAEKWNIKKIVFTSSIAPYGAAEELKKETTLPTPNTAYGISKLVAEKIHEKWQNGDAAHRQLTIVRPGVVFGKGENGNFTRLYWAIRGHKFAYPGRKDTIKACIYVKELVRFLLWKTEVKSEERRVKNLTALQRELKYLGLWKFAGAVMYVLHETLELSEEKMIAPMDEKRGKLLLSEILNGGNFGQHFTKYGHFTQQGMAKKYFLKIWRNMHFVRYYPAEALSEPVFRTWHFFWRFQQK